MDLDLPTLLPGTELSLRTATPADLDAMITILTADPVSAARGDSGPEHRDAYALGLDAILAAPEHSMVVAVDRAQTVVGMMQLTRLPGLARRGATRLQIETVHVRADRRSGGVGGAMMRWATDVAAPAIGATLIQLTSDRARTDAHRFYERLGFTPSHLGFKRTR